MKLEFDVKYKIGEYAEKNNAEGLDIVLILGYEITERDGKQQLLYITKSNDILASIDYYSEIELTPITTK